MVKFKLEVHLISEFIKVLSTLLGESIAKAIQDRISENIYILSWNLIIYICLYLE